MKLLPNEQTLVTSNQNKITLTTQRIQLIDKEWGHYYKLVFFLENISTIELRISSNIILLILSGVGLIAGIYLYGNQNNPFNAGTIAAVLLFLVWLFTRKRIISITADCGNKMNIEVNEMSQDEIESFIDDVQAAQLNRLSNAIQA